MKDIFKLILASAIVGSVSLGTNAASYGYCSDVASRSNIFRLGSTELQGMAIRLDHDKLVKLKGCAVAGVDAVFGSARATSGTPMIFVKSSLDGESLAEQQIKISGATKWLSFSFDNPYVITGDEDCLYIGYTAEISTNATMLHSDRTDDTQGTSYMYSDGKWVDSYGLGLGNASIRANINDAPAVTDIILKPLSLTGYFKADNEYNLTAQVYNFGDREIKSFDVNIAVGDGAPVSMSFDALALKQGACYDIQLPTIETASDGVMPVRVELSNVNGGADDDASDNVFDQDVYFYPSGMERSILLEGFTGQECHNCPGGHTIINNFIASAQTTPIIEVMHHVGFTPDFFTMDADVDYTYFFGGSGTYAPAVMLNRMSVPSIGSFPAMGVSTDNLQTAYRAIEADQPYASLGIESKYDPETRQVTVKLTTYAHVDLPGEATLFNVMLIQDGIISLQIPYGANYEHDAVFRGCLTNNSWGILLDPADTKSGSKYEWATTFTLPEAIFSDYWATQNLTDEMRALYTIATDPARMSIVAYIGSYGDSPLAHTVHNAVSTPLGKDYIQGGISAIEDIVTERPDDVRIYVDGTMIRVDGEYDAACVYDIRGGKADIGTSLLPGIYVVRVLTGDVCVVRKVLVK